jgi:glycosyltransferase involved in cell wall biosynthesis
MEREQFFLTNAPRSFHIFVDSEQTAEKISKIYGVSLSRISALGLLARATLPGDGTLLPESIRRHAYFVYPAKFWPHKNHLFLLRVFAKLHSRYPDVRLVLTGSDAGNEASAIVAEARRLGVEEEVLILGYLQISVLDAVVANALALVMPTYLGPTNLPPILALQMGTPAICSDIHAFEEAIQSRLVLVSLEDEDKWVAAMEAELVSRRRVDSFTDHSRSSAPDKIEAVLDSFCFRASGWI